MVSLSNHEAPHRCLCDAFMVRQAHHEGYGSCKSLFSLSSFPVRFRQIRSSQIRGRPVPGRPFASMGRSALTYIRNTP